MKFVKSALASVLVLTLVACGGGGGDSTATIPAVATLDKTEFLGAWKSSTTFCGANYRYNPSYWASNSDLLIGDTTIDSTQTLYTDSTCTTKAGKVTLHLAASFSQGSVSGKTNVLRVILTGTGFSTSADGGTGVTLTTLPVAGAPEKSLLDVDAGKLYLSDLNSPLDADGYPTALSSTFSFIR